MLVFVASKGLKLLILMEGSGGDILPDCKVTWLLVEADLRGTITDKTKLKYGEFITRSDILICKCVSLPL